MLLERSTIDHYCILYIIILVSVQTTFISLLCDLYCELVAFRQ